MRAVARGSKAGWIGVLVVLAGLVLAACGGSSSKDSATTAASSTPAAGATSAAASGEKVDLTMWFWGDARRTGRQQGARRRRDGVRGGEPEHHDQGRRAGHRHLHRHLPGRRRGAKSGPDIGAQWATGPVLTQVWGGAVTAISDLVPADEVAHWLNTSENTYDGKVWAMPLYLIGIPWVFNKTLLAQAGITTAPATWADVINACKALRAQEHRAVRATATTPTGRRS